MKKENIQLLVVSLSVVVVSVFIYLLLRKGRYKVQQGELEGEDVITIMETWDSKSNEVIKKLHPKIRDKASAFINELDTLGIKYRAYSGLRTFEEQSALYGKGRTEQELITAGVDKKYSQPTENKVTNAKPGSSFHNYGLAFDGVEVKDKVAIWNNPQEKLIADTGKKYGFFWGGDFTSLKDKPHFEYQQFGKVSDLLAFYNSGNKDNEGYIIV